LYRFAVNWSVAFCRCSWTNTRNSFPHCLLAYKKTYASKTGKCQIVFELGRRDVCGLAIVPIRQSPNEARNPWSLTGPSDADPNAMRFIFWTDKGGLFVVDDKRRSLQQLGGDLVRSLHVTSICFDFAGELYAAGKYAFLLDSTFLLGLTNKNEQGLICITFRRLGGSQKLRRWIIYPAESMPFVRHL